MLPVTELYCPVMAAPARPDWQTIVAVIAVAHSPIGAWKFP